MTVASEPAPKLRAIHHLALRCRDAMETRTFYEGVLGLEFAGAFKVDEDPEDSHPRNYVHIFFKMTDGDFVAFFDDPETAPPGYFTAKNPFDVHFAMQAESLDEMERFKTRLIAAGLPVIGPLDHDFVKSIYTYDPSGYPVEITAKVEDHDQIMADGVAISDALLEQWSSQTADIKKPFFEAVPA